MILIPLRTLRICLFVVMAIVIAGAITALVKVLFFDKTWLEVAPILVNAVLLPATLASVIYITYIATKRMERIMQRHYSVGSKEQDKKGDDHD